MLERPTTRLLPAPLLLRAASPPRGAPPCDDARDAALSLESSDDADAWSDAGRLPELRVFLSCVRSRSLDGADFRDALALVAAVLLPAPAPCAPPAALDLAELRLAHRVALLALARPPRGAAVPGAFVAGLVGRLGSAWAPERGAAEEELYQIIRNFPDAAPLAVERLLRARRERAECAPAVRAALCILVDTGARIRAAAFRAALCPLFRHERLPEFATPLVLITQARCRRAARDAQHALAFLLAHWPVTDPAKELVFLRVAADLVRLVGADARARWAPRIAAQLADCVASEHAPVAEAACAALARTAELAKLCARVDAELFARVRAALASALAHWCDGVRLAAGPAEAAIAAVRPPRRRERGRTDAELRDGWAIICLTAGSRDAERCV
jgi:hypothetical protein